MLQKKLRSEDKEYENIDINSWDVGLKDFGLNDSSIKKF